MAFSGDFLYSLKQANPLVDIMSQYTQLKRAGHNYVCLCPFHSEKTPSCSVSPDLQMFHCFGCGAGGDVITFIMKIENLDYVEAVRYLAERANIPMPDNDISDRTGEIKKKTYEINRQTARFFYSQLKTEEGKKGIAYIQERQLKPETVKKYGIGFAPDSWNKLKNHLLAEGFTEDEIVTAGVCARTSSQNVFDVFRNRLIFPIIDLRGNIIAFGGRKLVGSDERAPKYLNSSDTPVFKKSRNLFSLNFAKSDCNERLILGEGYMDVIAMNQAGFENAVATLGTSLTPEQARIMSQYTKQVIIAYDSDGPGQKATARAINLFSEVGIDTRIIKMTGAKDPDEYIKNFGATRFKLLLDNCDGAVNFELNKCADGLDTETDTGKVEYVRRAEKVLATINSPVERDVYVSRVASQVGVSKQVITSEVNAIIKKQIRSQAKKDWTKINADITSSRDEINPDASTFPKEAKAESFIIAHLFLHPDKAGYIEEKLPPEKFVTSFNRKVYESILSSVKSGYNPDLSLLGSEFSPDEMGKISEMLTKSKDININEQSIEDYINVVLSHDDKKTVKGEEMSDEDFLDFFKNLKNSR